MDLPVSKLFDHPASHDAVRIMQSVCHPTRVNLAAWWVGSKSVMSMVEGFTLDLALHFHNSDCLHVSIRGTSFSLLFSKLYKLLL